jgi:hypothetical protein
MFAAAANTREACSSGLSRAAVRPFYPGIEPYSGSYE